MQKNKPLSQIIIYKTEDGQAKLEVVLEGESVWLSQKQLAQLFDCTVENVIFHLKNVFKSGELKEKVTTKESLVV
ncbi:hydroxyacid dehydrogenase, partial [Patescibacteria group bacterium]|nr:hydroxyacid dehydrogenase [Patescibacteria group bacterium]